MILLFLILALLLHLTILDIFAIGWIKPDLLLVVTVVFAMQKGKRTGLKVGLLAGALADIFSAGGLGINIFILGGLGFLIGYFSERIYKESIFAQSFICAIAVVIHSIVFYVFASFTFNETLSFLSFAVTKVLPTVIYTTVICPFVFKLFTKISYEK